MIKEITNQVIEPGDLILVPSKKYRGLDFKVVVVDKILIEGRNNLAPEQLIRSTTDPARINFDLTGWYFSDPFQYFNVGERRGHQPTGKWYSHKLTVRNCDVFRIGLRELASISYLANNTKLEHERLIADIREGKKITNRSGNV